MIFAPLILRPEQFHLRSESAVIGSAESAVAVVGFLIERIETIFEVVVHTCALNCSFVDVLRPWKTSWRGGTWIRSC